MERAQRRTAEEDEAFLRQLVIPEEDRRRRFPTSVWTGGYRWFRSPNVLCLGCVLNFHWRIGANSDSSYEASELGSCATTSPTSSGALSNLFCRWTAGVPNHETIGAFSTASFGCCGQGPLGAICPSAMGLTRARTTASIAGARRASGTV